MSFQRNTSTTARTDISTVQRNTSATAQTDCESVKRYDGSAWVDVWTNCPWELSDSASHYVRGQYLCLAGGTASLNGKDMLYGNSGSAKSSVGFFLTQQPGSSGTLLVKFLVNGEVAANALLGYGSSGATGDPLRLWVGSLTPPAFSPGDTTVTMEVTLTDNTTPLYITKVTWQNTTNIYWKA